MCIRDRFILDTLQAGIPALNRFNNRQKQNATRNVNGLNNISVEREVSPARPAFSLLPKRNEFNRKVVGFTLTGRDDLEPGASTNLGRIRAMKELHSAGIYVATA